MNIGYNNAAAGLSISIKTKAVFLFLTFIHQSMVKLAYQMTCPTQSSKCVLATGSSAKFTVWQVHSYSSQAHRFVQLDTIIGVALNPVPLKLLTHILQHKQGFIFTNKAFVIDAAVVWGR